MPLYIVREHILQLENTFYNKRTHSIVREHILLGDVVPTAPARVPKYVPNASLMCPYQLPSEAAAPGRYLSGVPNVFLLCSECVPNVFLICPYQLPVEAAAPGKPLSILHGACAVLIAAPATREHIL